MCNYVIRVVIDGVPHTMSANEPEVAAAKVICEQWFNTPVEVIRWEDYDPVEGMDEECE